MVILLLLVQTLWQAVVTSNTLWLQIVTVTFTSSTSYNDITSSGGSAIQFQLKENLGLAVQTVVLYCIHQNSRCLQTILF